MPAPANKYQVWQWHLQVSCSTELKLTLTSQSQFLNYLVLPPKICQEFLWWCPRQMWYTSEAGFAFSKSFWVPEDTWNGRMRWLSSSFSACSSDPPHKISLKMHLLEGHSIFFHHTFNRKKEAKSSLEQCSVLLKAVWGKDLVSRTG